MPSRTATVIRPDIAPGRRVLAISDIHGNLPFLKGVLAKAGYAAGKDVLVLVGDLLEKGQESLATLRYIMELSRHGTVYALCGNCDHIDRVFLEGRPGADEELRPVFEFWRERWLIAQMGAELGLEMKSMGRPARPAPGGAGAFSRGMCLPPGACPTFWRQATLFLSTGVSRGRTGWRSWTLTAV